MSFSVDVKKFVAKYNKRFDVATRELNSAIISSLVYKSPVRRGAFRGNWHVVVGDVGVPRFDINLLDTDGILTVAKAERVLDGVVAGDIVNHTNNAPYGPLLESGSSDQAPDGMVTKTALEFPKFVNEAVAFSRNRVK